MNHFQVWIFFRVEFFSGVNIFQGWIFLRWIFFRVNIFHMWIFPSEDSHSLLGLVLPVFFINKVLQYIVSTWSPWRAHALQAWTLVDLGSSYSFQSRSETFFWRRWTMSEYILLLSIQFFLLTYLARLFLSHKNFFIKVYNLTWRESVCFESLWIRYYYLFCLFV